MIDGRLLALIKNMSGGGASNPLCAKLTEGGFGYEEAAEEVVLPETSITAEANGNFNGAILDVIVDIVAGNEYRVVFDGTTYNIPATLFEGRGAILGETGEAEPNFTNYPFCIGVLPDRSEVFVQTAGTHTIAIYETVTTVHKVDAKYLPEKLRLYILNDTLYKDKECTVGATGAEIAEAFHNNFVTVTALADGIEGYLCEWNTEEANGYCHKGGVLKHAYAINAVR